MKSMIAAAVDREHLQRRPRLHRRVDIAEVPLVCRQRTVRVLEPLPAQQDQLVLRERRVHMRQRHAVEPQVPRGEPRVLPLVRHRHDVEGLEVAPPGVAPVQPLVRRRRLGRVAVQPAGHVVVEQLLAPQQPAERLPHHHPLISGRVLRRQLGVELVGLGLPLRHHLVEPGAERGGRFPALGCLGWPQPQPQFGGLARLNGHLVPEGALGAGALRIDGRRSADHVVVDPVFRIRRDRLRTVQAPQIGLVLAEQGHRRRAVGAGVGEQLKRSEPRVLDPGRRVAGGRHGRFGRVDLPGPRVAEPGGRQHVQGVGVRARVGHRDLHQQVIGVGLGVVHLDDPVPVLIEDPGVDQLVFGLVPVAPGVLIDQVLIGIRGLRIVIPPPVPRMARDRVEVPPVLLDVLAVIALRPGQAEGPLLQDRIAAVPQRQAQAQPLLDVAEPGQAVLAPPVGARPGMVVRQVVPRLTVRAVVLPDRAPLPLADVRPPPVPVAGLPKPVLQPAEPRYPLTFGAHRRPSVSFSYSSMHRALRVRGGRPSPDIG